MISQPYDPSNPFQTGCIIGMPNDVYHEAVDPNGFPVINGSKLKTFHDRPKDFEGIYVTKEKEEPERECLITGSAGHTFLFESEEAFNSQYTCLETPLNWQGKTAKSESVICMAEAKGHPLSAEKVSELAGKKREEIEQYFYAQPGRTILKKEQFDLVKIIREQVHSHREAAELLERGVPEVTFRTPILKQGYSLQCRFDWLNVEGCARNEGRPYSADLKTIDSLMRWQKEFEKGRKYYRAYALYRKVQEVVTGGSVSGDFFWIVAEKKWPYSVMVKHATEECYEKGMGEVNKDLLALAECMVSGHYPDPGDGGITEQELSPYMLTDFVPDPGIKTGPEYIPQRNYEYSGGWKSEGN